MQAHELAGAGGEGRLARAALERVLPRRERALLAEALRAEAGVPEAAAEVKKGSEEQVEEEEVEVEAEEVEWVGGVPLLVFLALNGLEACALCVLPHLPNTASHVAAADADGFTALHCAANLRLPRLASALLLAGAPVDSTTSDVSLLGEPGGRSPLHLAAAAGATAIASMLLGAKAARRAEDWQGATPFLLACRRGHMAVAQLLAAAARGAAAARAEAATRSEGEQETEAGEEEEEEAPCEQELRGFELVEGIAVRARASARLRIDDRPKLHAPFELTDGPLLSAAACASLVAEAEAVAAARGGWDSSRHKNHPTVDMPAHALSLRTYHRVRRAIDNVVLPQMQDRYACRPLCVREAFIAKYEAKVSSGAAASGREMPSQAGLEMHRDGSLLNCVILLNPRDAFEGGGTAFAPPLDQVHATQVGGCLCSCGQLQHGAAAVTRGVRYVLIAFLDEQQLPPDDSDEEDEDEEKEEQERQGVGQGVQEGEGAAQGGVTGGLSEHTQLLMDAEEAKLRGFRPDEEVVMPLPVWSDSDED